MHVSFCKGVLEEIQVVDAATPLENLQEPVDFPDLNILLWILEAHDVGPHTTVYTTGSQLSLSFSAAAYR